MKVLAVATIAAFVPLFPAAAFERDVHFGLTRWLALQAGYLPDQAVAIATGNQRVDRGGMQFMELMATYACGTRDAESAAHVQSLSFAGPTRLPAPPEERTVVAGGPASTGPIDALQGLRPDTVGYTLFKFGEAIHTLQDSWAHQGVPTIPEVLGARCDPGLAWGHPATRGGPYSHRADQTSAWPADTLAMAAASYTTLLAYPPIGGAARKPVEWSKLVAPVQRFAAAGTKDEKAAWFRAQHVDDVGFLAGTSLSDGKVRFTGVWNGDSLPPLPAMRSGQHDLDPALNDFLTAFLTDWAMEEDLDAVANRYVVARASGTSVSAPRSMNADELGTRMRGWRALNHGSVADLLHDLSAFGPRQIAALKARTAAAGSLATFDKPQAAFLPILPKTRQASPIMAFQVTRHDKQADIQEARATFRFRHAPYDTLNVAARRTDGVWKVIAIGSLVEH